MHATLFSFKAKTTQIYNKFINNIKLLAYPKMTHAMHQAIDSTDNTMLLIQQIISFIEEARVAPIHTFANQLLSTWLIGKAE